MPTANDTKTSSPIYGVSMADASIGNSKLADGAISTTKVIDRSITTPKLADSSITTNKVADASITTDKIADGAITATELGSGSVTSDKLAALNYAASATINQTKTSAGSAYTNSSFTFTATGRPVLVLLVPTAGTSKIEASESAAGSAASASFSIRMDAVDIGGGTLAATDTTGGDSSVSCPPGSLVAFTVPSVGSHTFDLYLTALSGTSSAIVLNAQLMVIEL